MIAAVIFDLDGTVLDNEEEWETAFQTVISNFKLQISNDKWKMPNGWIHEPGIGLTPNWKKIVGNTEEADKLARQTWNEYWKINKRAGNIKVRDGVEELVAKVREMGLLTALCTSGSWNVVESELEQLNLFLAFDITTTGDEVLALKPDPEIYTLTAQKLEVDPQYCVVVEDAVAGVRAGVDAGMDVMCLESGYAPKKLLEAAGARWVIKDLSEVWTIL